MKNYFGILVLLALMACNQASNQSTDHKDTVTTASTPKTGSEPVFTTPKLAGIYTNYVKLKDALVATNMDAAKRAAKTLTVELRGYTGCENTAIIAQRIVDAKDIAAQRKEFTSLSTDVIALFKHAELSSGEIYVQHCPMANNGDGGDWLASEKKIQNPYYGKEMMECGAVVAQIKAK